MSAFSEIILTQRGTNLLAKAQAGLTLHFTRIVVGNGELNGQSAVALNNLINPIKSLPVSTLKSSGNTTTVGTTWNNEDIKVGFYFREIGIFATDPTFGEILYAYGNSGALAEYIPPLDTNLIERTTQIKLYVSNVANVTAVIDTSLVYATTSELQILEEKVNTHLGDDTKHIPADGQLQKIVKANNNTSYTVPQLRNVIISTLEPSGGSDGDIWIKYV